MSNKPKQTAEHGQPAYAGGQQIMDCAKCKSQIEQETAQKLFEEIEWEFSQDSTSEVYLISFAQWQQLKERHGEK